MPTEALRIFVACAPGLEPWLARELVELGMARAESIAGGVQFQGDLEALYRVHLYSGLGSHVRVRIGRFEARHFSQLAKQSARVDWRRWIAPGSRVVVSATSKRSKLYHTGGIEQRVREAIDAAIGGTSEDSDTEATIHVRLVRDRCDLSVDTCGEALHRRGWRQQTAKAPMREDLAHALVRVSGWEPGMTLTDPMMGSGTLIIEAARIARRIAPGRDRSFAFETMPGFDAPLWGRTQAAARSEERELPSRIVGRDRARGALEAARGNAQRGGVLEDIELEQAELQPGDLDGTQAVVCNPPYGKRVEGPGSVRAVWNGLAQAIAASASVQRVGLVVPDRSLLRGSGLHLEPRLLTDHGGIKVEFMVHPPPEGR